MNLNNTGNPAPQADQNQGHELNRLLKSWVLEIRDNKLDMLDLLLTTQRLLMRDAAENEYNTDEMNKIDYNLLILQKIVMHS